MGHRSEAVYQALAIGVERLIAVDIVEFAVKQHTLGASGNIGFGEIHLQIAVDSTVFHKLIA